jgi:hypothetical protein
MASLAVVADFIKEVWKELIFESRNNLQALLYFFILLGLFLLMLSLSYFQL